MKSFENVIVEFDSQVLVSTIRKTGSHNSSVALVIDDCKILFHDLVGCSIVHV